MKVRHKGGLKEATGYKKHLKALKKATTTVMGGVSYKKAKATNRGFGSLPYVKYIPMIGKGDTS